MRIMYDTTDVPANVIPADAAMVAGYVNGRYRSFGAVSARCPNAEHVSIAVTVAADADVLDIEAGDARPDQAPGWIARQHARGVWRPTLYYPLSSDGAVVAACAGAGFVARVHYDKWVAAYPFPGHAPNPAPVGVGEVAKQFVNHGPHGENYDMSAVYDDGWPHRSQQSTGRKRRMDYVLGAPGKDGLLLLTGGSVFLLLDPEPDTNAFIRAGAVSLTLSPDEWQHFRDQAH